MNSFIRYCLSNGIKKYCHCILLGLACITSGCATPPTKHFVPPTNEMRAALGDIYLDVMPYTYGTNLKFEVVGAGEGAAAGAAVGAAAPLHLVQGCVDGFTCVIALGLGLVLMPVGAITGGLVGAAAAPTEEKVSEIQALFLDTVNDFEYSNVLEYHFIKHQNDEAKYFKLIPIDNDATTLPNNGSVIELRITKMHWVTVGSFDPDVFLVSNIEARLIKDNHINDIYSRTWEFQSSIYELDDLLKDDSKKMNNLMEKALSFLAKQAVYDLFINNNEEKELNRPVKDKVRTVSASHEVIK